MADFSSVISGISKGTGTTVTTVLLIIGVIFAILIVIGILFWIYWSKKRYNLRVEIKMIRSNGRIIIGEWGKGMYNAKRGVVYIKRPKMRAIPMKVFDISRIIQGEDLITVIQVGAEDYRPVINDSWTEHVVKYEDENGNIEEVKEAVLNIKVDTGLNKPWKSSFESASKRAYSLQAFLTQFQVPISIAIVIISVFVGFAVIWTKIGSVCGK